MHRDWYRSGPYFALILLVAGCGIHRNPADAFGGSAAAGGRGGPGRGFGRPAGISFNWGDDFDGGQLDQSKWYPFFLPHWSRNQPDTTVHGTYDGCNGKRAQSWYIGNAWALWTPDCNKPRVEFTGHSLKLRTVNGQGVWSPFDHNIRTVLQTGNTAGTGGYKWGMHEFGGCKQNPNCVTDPNYALNPWVKNKSFRYGYFEMRAKLTSVGGFAWWMVGYEISEQHSAEFDIIEIAPHKPAEWRNKCNHFGMHGWDDPKTRNDVHFFSGDDCTFFDQWHTYGFLWTPDSIRLFIDGRLHHAFVGYPGESGIPDYEMVMLIDVGNGHKDQKGPGIRNEVEIDYIHYYTLD